MPRLPERPVLLRAAGLVLGGALVGLGVDALRPEGVIRGGFEAPTTCSAAPAEAEPVVTANATAVSSLCGHAGVLFADARPSEDFAKGHIAGAVHLPCDASASGAEGAMRKLGSAETIIVYGATVGALQSPTDEPKLVGRIDETIEFQNHPMERTA